MNLEIWLQKSRLRALMKMKNNRNTLDWKLSGGSKKLWDNFLTITKEGGFKKEILKLKRKYSPNFILADKKHGGNGYSEAIDKICRKYELESSYWGSSINNLVQFGETLQPDLLMSDLCSFDDIIVRKKEPFDKKITAEYDKLFPLSIRISPYASENDITNYVRKFYKIMIEPKQFQYKKPNIKIGKFRTRINRKRDNFIIQHPDMKRKDLQKLVFKEFHQTVTLQHISVIRRRGER